MTADPAPLEHAGVVVYAAVSLDGCLAEVDDGLGFLDDVAEAGSTYEVARSVPQWPYAGRPCVVVTSQSVPDLPDGVSLDDGADLGALVGRLRGFGRVWVVGGGVLVRALLAANLVDELDLTLTPHVLGDGVSLWGSGTGRHRLTLTDVSEPGAAAVRLRYRVEPR